jgi:hypothetical protein
LNFEQIRELFFSKAGRRKFTRCYNIKVFNILCGKYFSIFYFHWALHERGPLYEQGNNSHVIWYFYTLSIIAYPSGAPEFTPGFKWGSCYSIFTFICMFGRSLFVLLYFFFWPLCCLFFDIRILITSLWYLQTLLS